LISGNTSSLSFTKAVTGTNASLIVDGIPISGATNTVSNVINGVTLNLSSPSPNTPVTVSVNHDTNQVTNAINNLVSAYNTVINEINSHFNVAPDGDEARETVDRANTRLTILLKDARCALRGESNLGVEEIGKFANR
jgi:flagellar capping protein FliD